jgi:hypothetical protein
MTLSVIVLFRVLSASQAALTVVGFLRSTNPLRVKVVLVCLGLGVLSYFVVPLVQWAPVVAVLARATGRTRKAGTRARGW